MRFPLFPILTLASFAVASPVASTAAVDPCQAPAGTNVLKLSGFESGKSAFSVSAEQGSINTRVVNHGHNSHHSLANTLNTEGGFLALELLMQNIKTCNGATYTYSIDYKYAKYNLQNQTNVQAYVQYGPESTTSGPTVVLPGSTNQGTAGTNGLGVWSTQSQSFTAQDNKGAGFLRIQIASMQNEPVTVFLDNIKITKN